MSDHAAQKLEDRHDEAEPPDELDWPLGKAIERVLGLVCLAPFVILVLIVIILLLPAHLFRHTDGATLTAKERQAVRDRQIGEALQLASDQEAAR